MENSLYDDFIIANNYVPILDAEQECALSQLILNMKEVQERLEEEKRVPTLQEEAIIEKGMEARETFINSNIKLARAYAKNYYQAQSRSDLQYDDYEQAAMEGLIVAVDKYDYKKRTKFSTYATHWIMQKLRRATEDLGETIRKPANFHQMMRDINTAKQAVRDEKNVTNVSVKDIVNQLHKKGYELLSEYEETNDKKVRERAERFLKMDAAKVSEAIDISSRQLISLDQQKYDDDSEDGDDGHESIFVKYDAVDSEENVSVVNEVNQRISYEAARDFLSEIPDKKERTILMMYFGFLRFDLHAPLSCDEIAWWFKMPKAEVEKCVRNKIMEWRNSPDYVLAKLNVKL